MVNTALKTKVFYSYNDYKIAKNEGSQSLKFLKSQVGGKTFNSFEMISNGKDVPEFFGLGKVVFDDLTRNLKSLLDNVFHTSIDDKYTGWSYSPSILGKACSQIEKFVTEQNFSDDVLVELKKVYNLLGGNTSILFVRSSSYAEDGAKSFAGRQLSVGYIKGFENFLQSIKNVCASLYSYQAVAYRLKNGLDIRDDYMLVLVQKSADPTHSCVGFYYEGENPRIELDFAEGTGATIADGIANATKAIVNVHLFKIKSDYPSQWIVSDSGRVEILQIYIDKSWHKVVEFVFPIQGKALIYNPMANSAFDNTTEIPITHRPDSELYKHLLDRAVQEVETLSKQFESGQDIELAISVNDYKYGMAVHAIPSIKFYNIQSRLNTGLESLSTLVKPQVVQKPIRKNISIKSRVITGKLKFINSKEDSERYSSLNDEYIVVVPDGSFEYDAAYLTYGKAIFINSATNAHGPTVVRENFFGGGCIISPDSYDNSIKDLFDEYGLKEDDIITIDDEGNMYKGIINELVDWQSKVDEEVLKEAKSSFESTPLEIGFNAASVASAKNFNNSVGEFVNPLIRAERLLQDNEKNDILSIALDFSNEQQEEYVNRKALQLKEIVKYSKKSTYRFFGPCGDERTGLGAPKATKLNPTKLGMFQGVRAGLSFKEALILECKIVLKAKQMLDKSNHGHKLKIMAQYTRTTKELKEWLTILSENGITKDNFKIGTMFEVPSLSEDIEELSTIVDFISIGTNDLFMLFCGLDRPGSDAMILANEYPINGKSFVNYLRKIVKEAKSYGLEVSLCGEILSQIKDLAVYLQEWGITSAPVAGIPDFLEIKKNLIEAKRNGLPSSFVAKPM
jgi:phosphoenolpyruvate synthase/pyruvate phosphate dikinase